MNGWNFGWNFPKAKHMYLKKHLLVLLFLVVGFLACPASKTDTGVKGGGGEKMNGNGRGEGNSGGGNNGGGNGGNNGGGGGGNEGGSSETKKEGNLSHWGLGDPNDPNVSIDGVEVDSSGNLVISHSTSVLSFMWLADTENGMVSKFDLSTRREVARYLSVTNRTCASGTCVVEPRITAVNSNPSRTAIDINGNAWVANRGFERLSSVTKIAADESDCIDRNGNGRIDTSRRQPDGSLTVLPLGEDECVLFTTLVCNEVSKDGSRNGARALAISKGAEGSSGDVWVGCYDEQAAYQLNSSNGQIIGGLPSGGRPGGRIGLGLKPYGAIVDSNQILWLSTYSTDVSDNSYVGLQGVDTRTREVIFKNGDTPVMEKPPVGGAFTRNNCGSYGLAIDSKNRVWLAGFEEQEWPNPNLGRNGIVSCFYEHVAGGRGTWRRCQLNDNNRFHAGRGIVVDVNDNVYMSSDRSSRLTRFRWNEQLNGGAGGCEFVPMRAPNGTSINTVDFSSIIPFTNPVTRLIGVGLDSDNNPWTVANNHQAIRVNLSDGTLVQTIRATGTGTGNVGNNKPTYYTYSDFTGYQLRNYTAPSGSYTRIMEGCARYSSWKSFSWEAVVPANTQLEVYVRFADTREALSTAERQGPLPAVSDNLSGLPRSVSTFMQLEFVLRSADRQSSPSIRNYGIEWACETPLN
ncbi:MAG: hypothetical protein FWD46_06975 [Cystobacterineae bacterium]|nr:hypothetical protein [Cystobacterineae bacterium]